METTKKDGFTRVQRDIDRKFNLITADGKLLSDEWFDWIDYFHDGLAKVERGNDEYNFIDTKGKLLSEQWFEWAEDFENGLALVQRTNGEYCKIDKNGKIIVSE